MITCPYCLAKYPVETGTITCGKCGARGARKSDAWIWSGGLSEYFGRATPDDSYCGCWPKRGVEVSGEEFTCVDCGMPVFHPEQ